MLVKMLASFWMLQALMTQMTLQILVIVLATIGYAQMGLIAVLRQMDLNSLLLRKLEIQQT